MIEVQCTSCQTRYRIDERVLPAERPTFKCSRCGHVFSGEPRRLEASPSGDAESAPASPGPEPAVPPSPDIAKRPRAAAPASKPQAASEPEPDSDPLARPFGERDEFKPGENLSFDFSADEDGPTADTEPAPEPAEADDGERWEVGEPGPEPESGREGPSAIVEPPRWTPSKVAPASESAAAVEAQPQPRAEPAARKAAVHSSTFFLLVFLFVAAAFGMLAALIAGQPAAARQMLNRLSPLDARFSPLARDSIALREVHTERQRLKGDRSALIVSGRAENLGHEPLHAIEIAVELLDPARRALAQETVYCGNLISTRMVTEMTPRELEFFQKLTPPKGFVLDAGQSSLFMAVFIDPPAGSNRLRVAVVQASPADAAAPAPHP